MNGYNVVMENGVKYTLGESAGLPDSAFGFSSVLSYQNSCDVGGMWFDLEFAHHAEQIEIDVANDGDIEYGFTEPALTCLDAKPCSSVQRMQTMYTMEQKHAP